MIVFNYLMIIIIYDTNSCTRLQSIEEEVHAKITEQMITKHFNLEPEDHSKSAARKNIKPFNIDDVSCVTVLFNS